MSEQQRQDDRGRSARIAARDLSKASGSIPLSVSDDQSITARTGGAAARSPVQDGPPIPPSEGNHQTDALREARSEFRRVQHAQIQRPALEILLGDNPLPSSDEDYSGLQTAHGSPELNAPPLDTNPQFVQQFVPPSGGGPQFAQLAPLPQSDVRAWLPWPTSHAGQPSDQPKGFSGAAKAPNPTTPWPIFGNQFRPGVILNRLFGFNRDPLRPFH